jgi:crotonobetainyl-CoA:carnitine CoA-transferase CaiB-like acyl-CoA transferase
MGASVNRNGVFNDFNAGKRGISLNLREEEGAKLLLRLAERSDVLMESYSAGAMAGLGLGLDVLRQANPDLIYVQASGFGATGEKKGYTTFGPTAQAVTGLTHQSGLPEREPAGWGFSYMDHTGGYYVALATLMALLHRRRTGQAAYVDLAQAQAGLFITGTSVLDHAVNGRQTPRTGNTSPWQTAAPHGVYPARGVDRWVAIAVRTDQQWQGLLDATQAPGLHDACFATFASRAEHTSELDEVLAGWTSSRDPFEIMRLLQRHRVPAGVCQTNADRVERDPQLAARGFLRELPQSEIGTWPVQNVPFRCSSSDVAAGAPLNRGAPCYGEDNEYVYGQLLGLSSEELERLAADRII